MQKTQVMKLNTSKDNVEAFFNKMKNKLSQVQAKSDKNQNYDITMIVKHQSKHSFKSNQNDPATEQVPTVKSILSENDPNVQGSPNKKAKPKIYNEDNQVESRMLATEFSIKPEGSSKNVNKSNQGSYASGRKVRQSNKIPSIGSLFKFQKKNETETVPVPVSIKNINKRNFTMEPVENEVNVEQEYNQDGSSDQENSSESIEEQQMNEEKLKKNISRKHIDIFPNIEINSAVSEQLLSLRNFNHLKSNKNQQHKRRCSIADQGLLSPISKKLTEDIKQQSTRKIVDSVKSKIKQNSMRKLLQQNDCINEVKNADDENDESFDQKESLSKIVAQEFMGSEADEHQKRLVLNRKLGRQRQRSSALVKKRIFDAQHQHRHYQSNGSSELPKSFSKVKTSSHLQISPHPQPLNNPAQQTSQQQDDKSSASSNQQPDDSVYVIENKLNDCIRLLEKNELSTLEDYLYEFKDKYFYVSNTRIQIKWRLLMAHCKENKKEFERAAINYNNVIVLAKENPKCLIIEPAQVYHRLGVCYTEIGWWNKGILAFAQALNRYKKCKNSVKYSECMNNLGTLYLQASSISLAQKCFIQSYNLKKSLYGKNSTKLLTSLFNIFQCNLLTKNYDQAQKVITVIEDQIISKILQTQPNKILYLGGLYRRKGKMEFLRGNIEQAENHYLKAFEKLSSKYPYCMEFGELISCLGLLKLDDNKYKEAKQYYDKAIMLMNFYCSKDSITILTLKKNLQYSVKMIKQQKQGWSSKSTTNRLINQ